MPAAPTSKGRVFPTQARAYADPATESRVYRLTDPSYASELPACYNRAISANGAFLLFSCDRAGSRQAFRIDLKSGVTRQLTDVADLDGRSLALLPGDRAFCYFAGGALRLLDLATLRERRIYEAPAGWSVGSGLSAASDGQHALLAERREGEPGGGRLRLCPLAGGPARTVLETPFPIRDAVAHPAGNPILFRAAERGPQAVPALFLADGAQRRFRPLKAGVASIGPAYWGPRGEILYLAIPSDWKEAAAIRRYAPESDADSLVAQTSQYAHFAFNRDASVFVGASRNPGAPGILIMLAVNRRELELCEHRSSHPETTAPFFSPDAQRVYFQSDRDGKPALYLVAVDKIVEKIN